MSGYVGRVDDFILMHYPASAMGSGYASNVQARIAGGETGATYSFNDALERRRHAVLRLGREPQRAPSAAADAAAGNAPGARPGNTTPGRSAGLWRGAAAQSRAAAGEGNIVGQDLGPSGGFAVFSLNAGYRLSDQLTLTAGIDNLFDRAYAEHLNAAPAGLAGYVNTVRVNEPGRTGWLKLDLHL